MKSYTLSILLVQQLISFGLFSQKYIEFGTLQPMGFSKLGAIRGCAGMIGDNYYILENDYGRKFDFNNNSATIVTIMSVSTGRLKKRVNLNEMISTSRKEYNSILFNDVLVWKDKLVGFYTYKNAGANKFLANIIVCDKDGKLIEAGKQLGDFTHDYAAGSFLWQGGLIVNGRNTLSVMNDFQYRFTPDSSWIITLSAPENGNVSFNLLNADLSQQKKVSVNLPLKAKVADLQDFRLDNNGLIYLITKTYKSASERRKVKEDDDYFYELHLINTNDNNKITSLDLNTDGKAIHTANIILTPDNRAICLGNFWNTSEKKGRDELYGFFTVAVNTSDLKSSKRNVYDLPEDEINRIREYMIFKFKPRKGVGVPDKFFLTKELFTKDGEIYAVSSAEVLNVIVRGQTGALNSYTEGTRGYMVCRIDKSGKIKWATGTKIISSNPILLTKINRPDFFISSDTLSIADIYNIEKWTILRWRKVDPATGEKLDYVRDTLGGVHTGYANIENMVVTDKDRIVTTVLKLPTGELNIGRYKRY